MGEEEVVQLEFCCLLKEGRCSRWNELDIWFQKLDKFKNAGYIWRGNRVLKLDVHLNEQLVWLEWKGQKEIMEDSPKGNDPRAFLIIFSLALS